MADEPTTPEAAPSVPESAPASPPPQPSAESAPVPQAKPESQSRPSDDDGMPKWPRYGQLHAQKKEAEARAASYERSYREAQAKLAQLQQTAIENLPLEQQDQHRMRQVLAHDRLEQSAQGYEQEAERLQSTRREAFLAKVDEARDRMPDFDQVFWQVPVTDVMADLITESNKAAEVAYWLGKNPREAQRISRLSPHQQGAEIARIEHRVSAVAPRRTSNAPVPPPMLNGQTAPGAKDPTTMTMAEYAVWRTAQMKAQRTN